MLETVYNTFCLVSLIYKNIDMIRHSGRILFWIISNIELRRIAYNPARIFIKNNVRLLKNQLTVIENYI